MRPYYTAPMFVTDKPAETRAFWVQTVGLRVAFDHPAYLGLRVGPSGAPAIGFITASEEHPIPVAGGAMLGIEVDDVDAVYAELQAAGVELTAPPEDMPWGERMFKLRDPNGIGVAIGTPCPQQALPEMAAAVR
jgi:catechol 2,3-dioxygenase-like lactoylglutathione lyase family enzyme